MQNDNVMADHMDHSVGRGSAQEATEMAEVTELSTALNSASLVPHLPPGASLIRRLKLEIASKMSLPQLHTLREDMSWHPFGIAIREDGRASNVTGRPIRFGLNEYEDITLSLSMPGASGFDSPLLTLRHHIDMIFKHGEDLSKDVFNQLRLAAQKGSVQICKPGAVRFGIYWNRCQAASSLVLLLACPEEKLKLAAKDQSTALGGVPTLSQIKRNSSASILEAYRAAKVAAKQGKTTVMAITIADVRHRELLENRLPTPFASADHSAVMGIGPEGVIIWQANGYTLQQYIAAGGGRLRSYDEADQFVDKLFKLSQYKGKWDPCRYRFFRDCFHVDLAACHGGHLPKLDVWLRMFVLEDVRLEHLYKFEFE
ncbi:hypothetical protein EJ03DRAFT_92577 [Teratosphaeria nubilosa]|uniref:Uncharacterized protein n=1 Tax=Teratosphaeria nubilosa TaxID=161662 RepID=A0A6G1LA89_9PEZI|nr:hypothetical protein EJ03DRAFT_92577 [Teratosphaeria nubilosa]